MKIAMCDDNKDLLEILVEVIEDIIARNKMDGEVVFKSNNYDDMENFIKTNEANCYLLDIDLHEKENNKTGIDLGKLIRSQNKNTAIMVISGSNSNINKVFEIKAHNYITKPVDVNYLELMIKQIYQQIKDIDNIERAISIESDMGIIYRVKCSDIISVEKENDNCLVYTNNGIIRTNMTLLEMLCICDKELQRTHKSFLCNCKYIDNVNYKKGEIMMNTGRVVLLGGKYKNGFRIAEG